MDQRIEARIAALEAEIGNLKELVAVDTDGAPSAPLSDRRGMVKLMAATAMGAVTGAALLGAQPVAAVDGTSPVIQGINNLTTAATGLHASQSSGIVVQGDVGVGIIADGVFGNAWFPAGGASPAGTATFPGVLWVDGGGNWWAATVDSDTDSVWRKLAGPSTAGQLHILPVPVRVYDSRPGLPPVVIGPKSQTVGNTARTIDTTGNGSNVPSNATGVLVNLTIAGPLTPGFAAAWPTGPYPGTSSVNFAAGQNVAATTVVGCGPSATIQVLSNTVSDFLIDVIGYYQ